MKEPALILADGMYVTGNGKPAHGLVRGSDRFDVRAVIDASCAGEDAGVLLDGINRSIPVVASLAEAATLIDKPASCIVGIATHGGRLTDALRNALLEAAREGYSLVNGLHDFIGDDEEISAAITAHGARIVDVRKPRPRRELHFWEGEVHALEARRIAVLGTDCALGKRTTTRFLVAALNRQGVAAEMIYTGQTGWMQGARYGFVLDSVVNDYVCGELEHALVSCEREAAPQVMLIEGQSALRNPSGPCGTELLLSGALHGVILQHAPARRCYEGYEHLGLCIPSLVSEIELIARYGVATIGAALNGEKLKPEELERHCETLTAELGIPVVAPLQHGVDQLAAAVRSLLT